MERYRKVSRVERAEKVNMGGIILDQALPLSDIEMLDPFLLIHHWKSKIHGGQKSENLGVGPHPHRGFSPVTLVFEGGVHHRDSIGNSSIVMAGGTQWMDSGKGIVHSERPVKELAENGGDFELIQFWVNSPSANKMGTPEYYEISKDNTPIVSLGEGNFDIRIISGICNGVEGPVKTHTPMMVLRFNLLKDQEFNVPINKDYNALIYILNGNMQINSEVTYSDKDLIILENEGDKIRINPKSDCRAILLSGEPIGEEVYSYGPFVMNNKEEITQALDDYQLGNMGYLDENFE